MLRFSPKIPAIARSVTCDVVLVVGSIVAFPMVTVYQEITSSEHGGVCGYLVECRSPQIDSLDGWRWAAAVL